MKDKLFQFILLNGENRGMHANYTMACTFVILAFLGWYITDLYKHPCCFTPFLRIIVVNQMIFRVN